MYLLHANWIWQNLSPNTFIAGGCYITMNWNSLKCFVTMLLSLNTLRLNTNGRHFPDDIYRWIFLNENVWISIKISLRFVPWRPINNILALVQIMAWHLPGDKALSEPMVVSLLMHICVTRPQWVKPILYVLLIFHGLRYQVKCFSHMHLRVPKASDNWSGLLYLPLAILQEAGLLGTRGLWVVNMQDTHWGAADW